MPIEKNEGQPLGATHDFPEGKMNEHDEGGIRMAIGHTEPNPASPKGNVIIEFGTPVKWVGMGKREAVAMGNLLIFHAQQLPD